MTTKNPTEAEAIELLDAKFSETPNVPAVRQSAVEQVVTALSDAEWDGVSDGHIGGTVQPRLPRLLLNRKAGQKESGFTDELTGDVFTSSDFVWLGDTTTRAWWPLPFGKGDKEPACRSRDGLTPDPQAPAQQAGWQLPDKAVGDIPASSCAACPNAVWGTEGAPCSQSVEVMIYLLDQQRLSLVRFGGMAVSRVNRYLGALDAHVPRKPPLAYVTHVELEEVETDNGTFLVPRFSVAGEIPRQEATPLIELQRAKLTEWVEQLSADLAEGRTRDDSTATTDRPAWTGDPDEEPF